MNRLVRVILMAIPWAVSCDSAQIPIVIHEKLLATVSCEMQTQASCSEWSQFMIPINLDLKGRPAKELELDSLRLKIKIDSLGTFFQFKTLLISFRNEGPNGKFIFTTTIDPSIQLQALISEEPVNISITPSQHEMISSILKEDGLILLLIATGIYGQVKRMDIAVHTNAKVVY